MANPLAEYNDPLLNSESGASRDGTLFRAFLSDTVPAGQTRDYIIDIPVGIDVFGFFRGQEVDGETVTAQFLTCTGFTPSTPSMVGLNFDRTGDYDLQAKSTLKRATSLTGVIAHSAPSKQYVATTGPTRAPSNQTIAGAQPCFRNGEEIPAFRYVNVGSNAATLILTVFWQELPNGRH